VIWTLIGTLMVGVLAASLTFVGFRLFRREPPRWLLPAAAGLAMLIFHIASDYAWFGRTTAAFPEHLKVGESYTKRNILQPWTLVAAPVVRFSAVDTQAIRRNPAAPDLVMAEVHLLQRYYPTVTLTQLYDCSEPRRAAVGPNLEVDADGRPINANWVEIDADDPLRQIVCSEPTSMLDQRSTRSRGNGDTIREREQWRAKAFWSSTTSRASGST
jgi:hypothetical protein